MKKQQNYILAMLVMLLLFLGAYKTELEPLHSFSLRFNDINFALQSKPASKDVVLVAIDEASVNRFGRWPWRRDVLAHAIDNLDSESLLVFDMVFSEQTEHDKPLAESMVKQDNSICGFFLRHRATASLSEQQKEILSDSSLERLATETRGKELFVKGTKAEVNIEPIFSACTLSGSFSTLRDSDQLLRKYPVAFTFNDEILPSIGTQALRMRMDKDIAYAGRKAYTIGNHHITTDNKGFSRLNYYPLESYVTYSFAALYDGVIDPSLLKDKVIILGLSEVGLGDIRITPLGQIPGALVHYTFISNVLDDVLLHENALLSYLSLLLFLALPLIWMRVKSIYSRAVVYIAVYSLFFITTKLAYLYFNLYLDAFYPLIALLLSAVVSESILYKREEKQTSFIENAFASYLSPQLLAKLIHDPKRLQLGGEKKELTIFFSDIRSFTSISEKMDAQSLTHYLNRYFTPMSDIVMKYNGMIDKYIGDALMAFYNAPVDVKEHAVDACRSALEMLVVLKALNKELKQDGLPPIEIGIGINTAEVVVGNMGSEKRFNYTVIGDGVNLTSRIEGLNKTFGTKILITAATKAKLGERFLTRRLALTTVKGKEEEVQLYELLEEVV